MKTRIGIVILSAVIISCVLIIQRVFYSYENLNLIFCNVGQGDAIYIRTPNGVDVLIDAGPDSSVLECLGRHMPFWDKTIEIAFATHPDADHITGFKYVLDSYTVKSYYTSNVKKETGLFKLISEKLEEKHVSTTYLEQGSVFKIGRNIELEIYWPSATFVKSNNSDVNKYSIVTLLNFNNFNALLTGDADFDIVDQIISVITEKGVSIEVFKLPHHGSKTGVSTRTFTIQRPQLSIISAGENNRYGHPHADVLNELKKYNMHYIETKNGDIKIIIKDGLFKLEQY